MWGANTTKKMTIEELAERMLIGVIGGVALAALLYMTLSGLFALGPDLAAQGPFLWGATAVGGVMGFALGASSPDRMTAERRLLPSAAVGAAPLLLLFCLG